TGQRQALPVLKVLYRNSAQIHKQDAHHKDVLTPIAAKESIDSDRSSELLRDSIRTVDWQSAESPFATIAPGPPAKAFNDLDLAIQYDADGHRVVLAWRSWAMLALAGEQFADTLLRQSVRYCLNVEQQLRDRNQPRSAIRELLPRLLDEHKLLNKPLGDR